MGDNLVAIYKHRVEEGAYSFDEEQFACVKAVADLAEAWRGYDNKPKGFARFFGAPQRQPAGFYLCGDVGRGKSMLMDLFYQEIDITRKKRIHFHAFMLELHEKMFRYREKDKSVDDILPRLARDIGKEISLLCFDEFFVNNIVDAMLLGRLFESLVHEGVLVFITSNWRPDDLYLGGLQREQFLPFIAFLKKRFSVYDLKGRVDHRFEHMPNLTHYYWPLGEETRENLQQTFRKLTNNAEPQPLRFTVQGRLFTVWQAVHGVAVMSFDELCAQPLGAADYMSLCDRFRAIFVENVPLLTADKRNETLRFVTLVDTLYQAGTQLFMSMAAAPELLCAPDNPQAVVFKRTKSRLAEMETESYTKKITELAGPKPH